MMDLVLEGWVGALIELNKLQWMLGAGNPWKRGEKLKLLFAGYNGTRNTGSDIRVEEILRQVRRILGPDNDLVGQINQCIAEANAFYRLSFDPPRADHPDEYHDLQVQVNQPGMMVRTNSGYYNEPPGN